jgi:hypothetical protein
VVIEAATETIGEEKRGRNEWYGECRESIREKNEDYVCYREQDIYDAYNKSRKKS